MVSELIYRTDALAVAMHSKDPVEGIKNLPAVDAVEVKHGRWVNLTECSNEGVYCSVCHKKVYKADYAWCNKPNKVRSNYCPNCGADMRGE